jgi:hypothetical protein
MCLPTAPVLPIMRTETSAGLDFMGSFSDKNCLPRIPYGYANFEHNGGGARFGSLSFNTMILQPDMGRSLSLRRLKEPNATADRCIDGRGMSFGLEDQKPQLKPPSSPLGLFFPTAPSFAAVAIKLKPLGPKMEPAKILEKYTAKHIDEITDRIIALRVRWLRHVETELASQQSRPALDRYEFSTDAAE